MRVTNVRLIGAIALFIALQSCSTIGRMPSGMEIGAGVGERMGASIGRKTGNCAVGAVIGAALCGSAGNLLDRYISELTGANKPSLYIVNGVPYSRKKALNNYKNIHREDIQSISRMTREEAVAKYGSVGENGAVVIALLMPPLPAQE